MKSHAWFLATVVGGLVVAPSVGLSQDGPDQAKAVKRDSPGPVHRRLNDLVGTWDVAIQYKLGDKTYNGKATCEAKWILDGRFVQQEYKSRFQGEPFQVIQLLGYDNPKKKTVEIMIDSRSTGVRHNEGSISDDGKVITNFSEGRDPATGKPYKLRTVTTIVDPGHFTLEWFQTEEGGKEKRVVGMTHTRHQT